MQRLPNIERPNPNEWAAKIKECYLDPPFYITCSSCGQICGIIHDLDVSDCCRAKIKK